MIEALNCWFALELNNSYEVNRLGQIRRVYKHKPPRLLTPYRRHNSKAYWIKINGKEYKLARLIYETFAGEVPEGKSIYHIDGYQWNNHIENLACATKEELGKITGYKAKAMKVAKIDKEGKIVKTYRSAREAGKDNHMSYQTILDRCNNKIKKPYKLDGHNYQFI